MQNLLCSKVSSVHTVAVMIPAGPDAEMVHSKKCIGAGSSLPRVWFFLSDERRALSSCFVSFSPKQGVIQNPAPQDKIQLIFKKASGMLRLRTPLHSHSSGLLIHRSGCSHVYSGLKAEMEFGEVKIRV